MSLRDLMVGYGSDKASAEAAHEYCGAYEQHFGSSRLSVGRVLEIGVQTGASLYAWQDYFPSAQVFGIDIDPMPDVSGPRITTLLGSQDDPVFLRRIATQHGPFDIIIDDGSHVPSHIITSLETLFPYLVSGGTYVIEDTQTSYWPQYQAGSPITTMAYLQDLCDGLNWPEHRREPSYLDSHIEAIEFWHNLCFLRKIL